MVLSKAFGGDTKNNNSPKPIETEEEFVAAFKNMFGEGTVR